MEPKKQNPVLRFFAWLLIFPIIFEKLAVLIKEIYTANARLNQTLLNLGNYEKKYDSQTLKLIAQTENILNSQLDLMQKPAHNCTFLFTTKGNLLNLSLYRKLAVETVFLPGVNNNDNLRFIFSGDDKQIETIEFHLSKLRQQVPAGDKTLFEDITLKLRARNIKREELSDAVLENLINAMGNHYKLSYRQLAGICMHTLLAEQREEFKKIMDIEKPKLVEQFTASIPYPEGVETLSTDLLLAIPRATLNALSDEERKKLYAEMIEIKALAALGYKETVQEKSVELISNLSKTAAEEAAKPEEKETQKAAAGILEQMPEEAKA